MKLYYDMLVPFFPEYDQGENGEYEASQRLSAGRNALIMLSNFQKFGSPEFLYRAVGFACVYKDQPIGKVVASVGLCETDFETPRIDSIIDFQTLSLFKSVFDSESDFSLLNFCAALLMCAHRIIEAESNKIAASEESETTESIDTCDVVEIKELTSEPESNHSTNCCPELQ